MVRRFLKFMYQFRCRYGIKLVADWEEGMEKNLIENIGRNIIVSGHAIPLSLAWL